MTDRRINHWRVSVSAEAGSSSKPVFLPRRFGTTTVKAIPGAGGTAKVQYTLDDPDDVAANPGSANWDDWEDGLVAAPTTRALVSVVMGLRVVAVSQPATMQVAMSFDF